MQKFVDRIEFDGTNYFLDGNNRAKKTEQKVKMAMIDWGVNDSDLSKVILAVQEKYKNTVKENEKVMKGFKAYAGDNRNQEFIVDWIRDNAKLNDLGEMINSGDGSCSSQLYIDILKYNGKIAEIYGKEGKKRYLLSNKTQEINMYWDAVCWDYYRSRRNEKIEHLKYSEIYANTTVLQSWKPILQCSIEELNIYAAGIRHFIWTVKRKFFFGEEANVYYEIMPILYSRTQNTGKSQTWLRFLSPWGDFGRAAMSFVEATDSRNTVMHSKHAVLTIDELAGFNKQEIENIKSFITARYKTTRKMYTHTQDQTVVRSSVVGSSNRHLRDYLNDPSGVRRFLQLPMSEVSITQKELDVFLESAVRQWKSVDENAPSPIDREIYPKVFEQLQQIQRRQLRTDPVTHFLNKHGAIDIDPDAISIPVNVDQLYVEFSLWRKAEGIQEIPKDAFIRGLYYSAMLSDKEETVWLSSKCSFGDYIKQETTEEKENIEEELKGLGI